MYWPSIDVDIVDFIRRCQECIKWSKMPKEPVQLHNIPEGRWGKLGMDYFYFSGVSYVSSDYFSKFPYMFKAKISFWAWRDHLINLFAIEYYPDKIVSDNGSPFNSQDWHNTYHFITLLPMEQCLYTDCKTMPLKSNLTQSF